MIYCVIPQALAEDLYDKLSEYYKDDPNVKVIIDRRRGDRRGSAAREHASKLREVLNRAERFVPDVVSAREPAA